MADSNMTTLKHSASTIFRPRTYESNPSIPHISSCPGMGLPIELIDSRSSLAYDKRIRSQQERILWIGNFILQNLQRGMDSDFYDEKGSSRLSPSTTFHRTHSFVLSRTSSPLLPKEKEVTKKKESTQKKTVRKKVWLVLFEKWILEEYKILVEWWTSSSVCCCHIWLWLKEYISFFCLSILI